MHTSIYKNSKLTPSQTFNYYNSIRLHFLTRDYDAKKYHFKTRAIFEKQPEALKYVYSRLSRYRDPEGLILSNLSFDPKIWINDLFNEKCQKRYYIWKGYQESQEYHFKEHLEKLNQDSFKVIDHQHPQALRSFIKGEIILDTFCILDDFIQFSKPWEQSLKGDPIWESCKFPLIKYKSFLTYDKMKIFNIMKEWMNV